MATLSVTVPNALVPELAAAVKTSLDANGVATAGLTNQQLGQAYVAYELKRMIKAARRSKAQGDAQALITQTDTQADLDIAGII
jgi:hypothetical protein